MKPPDICKSCKHAMLLAHGVRCRKRMRVRYKAGTAICMKYRKAKRFE